MYSEFFYVNFEIKYENGNFDNDFEFILDYSHC